MSASSEARAHTRRPQDISVIHVLRAPVGGLFRHVRDLAAAQSAAGMNVGVICDRDSADALTESRLAEMSKTLQLGLDRVAMARDVGPSDLTAWAAVRAIARQKNATVIHGHGAKGGAYARLAAAALRRSGTPVAGFYTPHGGSLHFDPSTLKGRIFMGLERLLVPMSTGIVFESEFARRTFEERVRKMALSRVIPNGLQPEEFADLPQDARAFDFVFVGELRNLKGVDVLLAALAIVAARRPVRLLIVGDGPDRAEFEAQADALGVRDKVSLPGAMPARTAFAQGGILVLPSRAESLPYVVLEAAAAGLPVIATDVGGIPEIVAGTGVELVAPGSCDALAKAMLDALDNPQLTAARAKALRSAVASRFTVATMADAITDFYCRAGVN